MPTVSVIMTVYNGERFLRPAVDSILAQTISDWELIVVDDGSKDATSDILLSYRDSRVKVMRYEQNRKQAVCSNRAIEVSTGRYIARLDADDISLPNRLEEQVGYLERHPDVALVGSAAFEINEEGARVGFRPGGLGDCALKLILSAYNPIVHSSVVFRADAARELNGYNEEECYWFSEDYEFLSRLACWRKAVVLSQPLIEYRVHPISVSASNVECQSQQGKLVTRASLERTLGRKVDDLTWSAWWRFAMTKPGCAVSFDAREVRSLCTLVPEMTRKVSHEQGGRCWVQWLWAKHALALALSGRDRIAAGDRARLAFMALKSGTNAFIAHR